MRDEFFIADVSTGRVESADGAAIERLDGSGGGYGRQLDTPTGDFEDVRVTDEMSGNESFLQQVDHAGERIVGVQREKGSESFDLIADVGPVAKYDKYHESIFFREGVGPEARGFGSDVSDEFCFRVVVDEKILHFRPCTAAIDFHNAFEGLLGRGGDSEHIVDNQETIAG